MRIPDVRRELRGLVDRLRYHRELCGETWITDEIDRLTVLIGEMNRRRLAEPAARKRVSQPMTPELRAEIREYARRHPTLTQFEVALRFVINPGRVSESLHGFRR